MRVPFPFLSGMGKCERPLCSFCEQNDRRECGDWSAQGTNLPPNGAGLVVEGVRSDGDGYVERRAGLARCVRIAVSAR